MFKRLLNIFKSKTNKMSTPLRTLRDVDIFDTVWIQDKNGIIYEGWIFDKTRKHIIVTASSDAGELKDYRFLLNVPLSSTEISQEQRTLYFNPQW